MRAIIVDGDWVALIGRERDGRRYFVFPGGGVEPGESDEEALARECWEELGIVAQVHDRKYVYAEKSGRIQRFYGCSLVGGSFGSGIGPEFTSPAYRANGTYSPLWLKLAEAPALPVLPEQICDALYKDLLVYNSIESIPQRWIAEQ